MEDKAENPCQIKRREVSCKFWEVDNHLYVLSATSYNTCTHVAITELLLVLGSGVTLVVRCCDQITCQLFCARNCPTYLLICMLSKLRITGK